MLDSSFNLLNYQNSFMNNSTLKNPQNKQNKSTNGKKGSIGIAPAGEGDIFSSSCGGLYPCVALSLWGNNPPRLSLPLLNLTYPKICIIKTC